MYRRRVILRPLHFVLALVALVAIALPLAVIRYAPPAAPAIKVALPKRVIVTRAELPPVEPVELVDLAPQDARSYNATIPFAKGPIPAARPFRFAGDGAARARATDCLAAAVWYEAGDDAVGEQAVAQVVLNRLRHPAFPKTVCGVVFQGAERSTGCQFTFTCDGALARVPSEGAWRRAREIAGRALSGAVYRKVGLATHYHTDWVVPYWSASLDKIAEVHTHLFFRWTGWWGTPPAFDRRPDGGEPAIDRLAPLSDAHRDAAALAGADGSPGQESPWLGGTPAALASDQNVFLTSLKRADAPRFVALAMAACGDRLTCRFMGWTDPAHLAATLPVTDAQRDAMSFSYIRDRALGLDRALWNCAEFKDRTPCMKRLAPRPTGLLLDEKPQPVLVVPARGPPALEGVRRKPATEETPAADRAAPRLIIDEALPPRAK